MRSDEPKPSRATSAALEAMRDVPTPGYDVKKGLVRHRLLIADDSSATPKRSTRAPKVFFGIAALAASVTLGALHFFKRDAALVAAGSEQSPATNTPHNEAPSTDVSPTSATVSEDIDSLPEVAAPTEAVAEREVRELAQVERALTASPARALALARASDARFSPGHLRRERRVLIVRALLALGRRDEANSEAVRFYSQDNDPAFRARVESALGRAD